MFEDHENEPDYTSKFRLEGSNDGDKFRSRSIKAERSNRRLKKSGSPGSIRLRRNKHWTW